MNFMETLATDHDKVWPKDKWPKMRLDKGLEKGSKGGHGPIKYYIKDHVRGEKLVFQFTRPNGFFGVHRFDIQEVEQSQTLLTHTIDIKVNLKGWILWYAGIKWLHDALIEDGLDRIHNQINKETKTTPWNFWVRILRGVLK